MKPYDAKERSALGHLVAQFMGAMHRYDAGRTLPLMHAAKLTTPQLAVLEFVRRPRTVSAVAVHVGLSRPAASQMIDKLVRRQLVLRSEGHVDRRERAVELSAKGKALLERIAAARAVRFEASLAVLPALVAAKFEAVLVEVSAELDKALPPAAVPGRRKGRNL
jgi:DNA-binding MarR family transcriptional regulator